MSPPLIRAVKQEVGDDDVTVVDVPPGTSCPVITALGGSDLVLLVTEPTPFGLNDLGLALDMVDALAVPHAVVVNRHDDANVSARAFCADRGVAIIAEIPDDRRVAEAYSVGKLASEAVPGYAGLFSDLWDAVRGEIDSGSNRRSRAGDGAA
jgi:MinD superfamily P-loop ATPase